MTARVTDYPPVSNKIFGVVLFAYIDGLHANIIKSKKGVVRHDDFSLFAMILTYLWFPLMGSLPGQQDQSSSQKV